MPANRPQPDARALALRLLLAVTQDGHMLSDSAPDSADPATRARALRLATTTLRHLQRADAVLAPLLRKPPPPEIQALLRLGVVEMLELGEAAHGVVNSAVAQARLVRGGAAFAGLVNAVLRRAAQTEGWAALPVPRLPGWLRRRLVAAYGQEAVAAMEAAHLAGAPLDLTLRPLPDDARAALTGALEAAASVSTLPGGSLRLAGGAQVSALPGYAEGQWWVQDAAAALPALLLAARPGETVLDLCAAPGGKTMQLAATGASVTALDMSEPRLKRLRANMSRTGLQAAILCADALEWQPPAPFDAILLDAPCSATGTIRRHPDLPLIRKPGDLAALTAFQAALLDRALAMLRPGGRLVYCTCSLLPEEGEAQVSAALARHSDLRLMPLPAPPFGDATPEGGWRTRPDHLTAQGGVDGFYIALLTRS
ncbi:RsmB/NOP family class I SAM-dependent RNA methyltransferase [Pararhodobacter sp.]|uniref:RsmB/NOP family class I SAM-dependent RNA methyltransferase n=1 Tax=Pararhodobacter sp. TaxID=2127056 RepID=UPI002FDECBB3